MYKMILEVTGDRKNLNSVLDNPTENIKDECEINETEIREYLMPMVEYLYSEIR